MLKGRQKIYTFTIQSTIDPNELTDKLNDIFYKKKSPIELFHVSRLEGKLILSFTMNQETFVSTMNPTNKVVYTSSEHKYTYEDFINVIYTGLSNVFEEKDITPTQTDAMKSKHKPIRFDKQLDIPFYRSQALFEIKEKGQMIDLTNNEVFMDYFFLDNFEISDVKKTLLRRMLMGLTSYYPIDRSKIGSMPTVVNPQVTQGYSHYTIAQKMTVETCMMSSLQFSKYIEVWRQEKKKDLIRQMRRHLHEELPFDFNIRTRQICNMIYKDDEFRYIKDGDRARGKKIEQYEELKQSHSLEYDQQLVELSPKLHRILTNIMKFRDGIKSTGKVLIYSDFRGDSGGEMVEQVLMANGYSLFDPTQPPTNSLKYTFITGEESVDQRKKNMAAFNDKSNKLGEQIQIMIISGAGAEGISLTCVRQVHILEPYWNFVRIDQVFGRAIRLFSHDDLDPKDRNVEEYIYLSVLPSGSSTEEIYQSIEGWDVVPKLKDVKSELAQGQHKELKDYAESLNIIYSTSVWDLVSAKEVAEIKPTLIKIPSATNLNFELQGWLCEFYEGQIHVSTGMSTAEEVEKIVTFYEDNGRSKDVVLYVCTSGYPVAYDELCLLEINKFKKLYGSRVGNIAFSGHHLGISADIAALTLGVDWIERHFTLDRTWKGTDHAASLEPDGMRKLVRDITNVKSALSYKETDILPIEFEQRKKLKWLG